MPTTGNRGEDRLIELFLSVYEDKSWAGDLSRREYPERMKDGGVEIIATQIASGCTLAIEHTIIEPFIGEKMDFFEHFQEFQRALRADESLKEPGVALYIDAPRFTGCAISRSIRQEDFKRRFFIPSYMWASSGDSRTSGWRMPRAW